MPVRFQHLRKDLGSVVGDTETHQLNMWGHSFQVLAQANTRAPSIAKKMIGEYRCMFPPSELALTYEDVVLDIGAHIGMFAIPAAQHARKVIAVEPAPANFQLLMSNVWDDPVARARVEYINAAVELTGAASHTELYTSGYGTTGHSTFRSKRGGEVIRVNSISFSYLVMETRATVIKMDAEGIEQPIMRMSVIPDWVRLLVFEWHLKDKAVGDIEHYNQAIRNITRQGFRIRQPSKQPRSGSWFTLVVASKGE